MNGDNPRSLYFISFGGEDMKKLLITKTEISKIRELMAREKLDAIFLDMEKGHFCHNIDFDELLNRFYGKD